MPDVQYPDDPLSKPSAIRIEDILGGDDDSGAANDAPPAREGLPRTFRMRADKHYVEMLDAPPQRGPKEEAAAAKEDEAVLAAAARAGNDLAQSLAALRTSTNLLADRSGLASTVALNLIRAEAWRATCLLQVSRFLRGEIKLSPKQVQPRAVIEQVLEAIEAERRLRGITIKRRTNTGERWLAADEQLLVGALSGVLMTIIGSNDTPDAVVEVFAEPRGKDVVFTFGHPEAILPDTDSRLAGFAQVVARLGGAVTMTTDTSTARVCVTFPSTQLE